MRRWLIIAVVVLVVLLAAVAAGGWWYVNDRVRISEDDLVTEVKKQQNVDEVVCIKQDERAEYWLCAVPNPTDPKCLRVHVRPWGDVDVNEGFRRCLEAAELQDVFPADTGGGGSTQG